MIYSDIHCHPILKCYGKNNHQASKDVCNEANLFHHDRFSLWDRLLENLLTLTPYRQADLFSAYLGKSMLLGSAMYAPERDFFVGKFDFPTVENWITDFGKDWIEEIQDINTSYYQEFKKQFEFIEALDGEPVSIKGKNYKYKVIRSGQELEQIIQNPEERTVVIFYNIEGGHNLFTQLETQKESSQTIDPDCISFIKSKNPFYFTLAHHFYNQLSGHCISLPPALQNLRPQEYGSDLGLRPQGEEVIRQLLSKENGPRILLDVKHMNPRARNEYYAILDEHKANGDDIPIIFSHGGANGMDSFENKTENNPLLHCKEIGLYDDEIVRLVRSKGLFGLNMDERVMSSDDALKATKKFFFPHRRFRATSSLIWNNIEQILKVTAKEGLNPWHCICIGSDYDGIINPVNGFWTLEYLPRFRRYLTRHLKRFLKKNPDMAYGMSPKEIMDAVFSKNTIEFMIKHYGA